MVTVVTVVGATVVVVLPDTVGVAVVLGAIVVFPGATVELLELQPDNIATQAMAIYFIILENLGTREKVIKIQFMYTDRRLAKLTWPE